MEHDNRTIRKYATVFRQAVEIAFKDGCFDHDIVMKDFPKCCCGDTADLIGEFLVSNGFDNLWHVCGNHYPATGDEEEDFQGKQSHAWISIGDPYDEYSVIVDITGDQFKDDLEYGYHDVPVYVGKRNKFYRLFEVYDRDVREFHGITDYDIGTQSRLFKLYEMIIDRIEW